MRNYRLSINDKPVSVRVKEFSGHEARLEINDTTYHVVIQEVEYQRRSGPSQGRCMSQAQPVTTPRHSPQASKPGEVLAPIPGAVLSIEVTVGASVEAGAPLLKLEAMKMENAVHAPQGGKVTAIHVQVGDQVAQGERLVTLEPEA